MLTLVRHGESEWNREARFSGWADVDLSHRGRAEAERAGRLLARATRPVDLCFTSMLRRAESTGSILLGAMGQPEVPVERSWRLNERHYGDLQGHGVWSAVRRHGPLTVLRCRRDFHARPPELSPYDPRSPELDPRYAGVAAAGTLPRGESVADALARLLPYWHGRIVPELAGGRHVLVVSHKHTLRALMRLMRRRTPGLLPQFRLHTAAPMVMRFGDDDDWVLERWAGLAVDGAMPEGAQ